MSIRVVSSDIRIINTRLRMPFRYGIASLTALPHAFIRVELDVNGTRACGVAADGLAPKWFTKNPDETFRDELAAMFHVIETACGFAEQLKPQATVFDIWQQLYAQQMQWATGENYPPLLWHFGVSLVERAIIEAFCRATNTSFGDALRRNTLGVRLGEMHSELADAAPADLLPDKPHRSIKMRRTIGLGDPIADGDIPDDERLNDGMPQSLEASIREYGLTRFKIKMKGDPAVDAPRLKQLHDVLRPLAGADYAFTMDLNEFFTDAKAFREYWEHVRGDKALDELFEHMLVVEQPMRRDHALTGDTADALLDWDNRPPIIIDESDAMIGSTAEALECGYVGGSYKSCKGVFKGVANACLIEYHRRADPTGGYTMTCEDLCILGPVALGQDLAAAANLGIEHCERAGIHYFAGIQHLPDAMQQQVLDHHGDLYHRHARGFVAPKIERGELALGTTVDAPFGLGYEFDPTPFTPLDDWTFESLGLEE